MKLRNKSLTWRFGALLSLLIIFFGAILIALKIFSGSVSKLSGSQVSEVMLNEEKQKIEVATNTIALALADLFPEGASDSVKVEMIRTAVDKIRFEEDKSGYYFVYRKTINVALPPNKALQGQDLGHLKDKNDVYFVKEMHEIAENGGGFVQYIWPKPNAGDQPKLSYALMIPGTDFWIGTGVYLDNVAKQKSAIISIINSRSNTITMIFLISIILLFGGVILPVTIAIIKSILTPVREIQAAAQELALGNIDIELNIRGNDEIAQMERAFSEMIDSLKKKAEAAEAIAEKDLTQNIELASEKDQLGHSLALMQRNLSELISSIHLATMQIDAGSGDLSEMSQTLSQASTEQAAAIEEVSSSIQEVEHATKENADNSTEADSFAKNQVESADNGAIQMKELEKAILEINHSSEQMRSIIKVIDDIAFQTNLLALNAAVEAARAGQHGKGFAVVAEEVRNLANRSGKAANEISGLIEDAIVKVNRGTEVTTQMSEVFNAISEGAGAVGHLVQQIANSSIQQTTQISAINIGVSEIEKATMLNSAKAEQAAASAEELSSQSAELQSLVSRFKTSDTFTQLPYLS